MILNILKLQIDIKEKYLNMAFSKSLPKGQIPLGCPVCETSNKIEWKCITCNNLMCNNCKKIHTKFVKDHKVIDIKEIGRESESLEKVIELKVVRQHTVDIENIHYLAVCKDGSLWISDGITETIQHITIEHDKVKTLSTYKTPVYDLATSPSGSTYIVADKPSILGIINPMTGQIIDSKFNVHPWIITCVHVTRDHSVIIGAGDRKDGIVIVMNTEGKQIKKYEHNNQQQIFKYPETITTTSQGIIVVGDKHGNKVVVLHPGGQVGYYHGHPDINSPDKPMEPNGLVTTLSDNILVVDNTTDYLHILNSEGEIITYYNPKDIGIMRPYSLALAPSGGIYLGCVSGMKDPEGTKAKLYELTFSGF